jgi:hypothetical protein
MHRGIKPTTPEPRDGVEDHASTDVEAFLDKMSPRHPMWRDNPSEWIYRGQSDASWQLKARAAREPNAFARYGVTYASRFPGYVPTGDAFERVGLVTRLLERFRNGLDQAGIVVPSAHPRIWREDERSSNIEPPSEVFPLMALAQHHGLPTLLLDWTRRAMVAAYFAAAEAADPEKRGSSTHLAVWAIRRGSLLRSSEGPNFYEAPGGTNPNLRAQAGLFSYVTAVDEPSIELHNARLRGIIGTALPLRRLHLPVDQAPKLLRLLSDEGISGVSMFPGADGVVRGLREMALWDQPPD